MLFIFNLWFKFYILECESCLGFKIEKNLLFFNREFVFCFLGYSLDSIGYFDKGFEIINLMNIFVFKMIEIMNSKY